MERTAFWKANISAASHEIPRILWDSMFITLFTRALYLSLSWASSIHHAFILFLTDPYEYYCPIYTYVYRNGLFPLER